jgi:sodium/hydrogen exchanger family protein
MDMAGLERKFDAVGYGIFIPIFFISSGMTLDLKAIARDPLRLLIFFALLLIVRGLPSLLVYRRALPARQRVEMTFITATTLPLLIALVDIGQQDGVMLPSTAAALVGAGVLSVLVYPLIAVTLHRSAPLTPADAGIPAAGSAAGTSPGPDNPEPYGQGDQTPQPLGLLGTGVRPAVPTAAALGGPPPPARGLAMTFAFEIPPHRHCSRQARGRDEAAARAGRHCRKLSSYLLHERCSQR